MRCAISTFTVAVLTASAIATSTITPVRAGPIDYLQKKYRNYKDEQKIKDMKKMDKDGAQAQCSKTRAYYQRNCSDSSKWSSYCRTWADKCNNG